MNLPIQKLRDVEQDGKKPARSKNSLIWATYKETIQKTGNKCKNSKLSVQKKIYRKPEIRENVRLTMSEA